MDDDAGQRILTRMVVENTGRFRAVWEAEDGRDAIAKAGRTQPDLVLLDLTMPVLDGLGAIPGLRAASPSSTIIVCSMVEDQDRLDAATRAGADGFVAKSLPLDRLEDAINAIVLRRRRPRRSAGPARLVLPAHAALGRLSR